MTYSFKERLKRFSILLSGLVIIGIITYFSFIYLYPFFISFIISLTLHPIVRFCENKWKMKRGVTALIVLITFFCFTFFIGYLLLRKAIEELTNVFVQLPFYIDNVSLLLYEFERSYIAPIYTYINKWLSLELTYEYTIAPFMIEKIGTNAASILQHAILLSSNFISSLAHLSLVIIFIVLSTYFLTKDFQGLLLLIHRYLPLKIVNLARQIHIELKHSIIGLGKAHIMMALLTVCLSMMALLFFQFDHILLIALTLFILDLIPYIGIGVLFIPWIIYHFFMDNYVVTIQLGIIYIVLIIVRQIIEPRLLSQNLGIHPLVIIIILFVSIKAFSALGLLLAPVILIILSSLYHSKIIHYFIHYIKEG